MVDVNGRWGPRDWLPREPRPTMPYQPPTPEPSPWSMRWPFKILAVLIVAFFAVGIAFGIAARV